MKSCIQLEYTDAQRILASCSDSANSLGVAASIAILDASGHFMALARMDGASFQTPEVARGKALTSAMMKKPSGVIETATQARITMVTFSDGRIPVQGAVPIFSQGQCVGAVGVSGGTPDQDEIIAKAGADCLMA
ncbi:GlcG/HbpS family heme-binding protein [Herbaspirillum huttiense]|uniref:GlcG/HbpS family heme-binding protein n=1 Tax=Herbaspirillum huttiense TaxID=863372 RepID=UPI002176A616|nr:heme-binding protein [Herbaspirillum huttiense]UWE16151.1 heme-binding protein [Herbaspirillum huttiense]